MTEPEPVYHANDDKVQHIMLTVRRALLMVAAEIWKWYGKNA